MAFFDSISKTVTEAGQKTIQKTKELADVSRLNTLISEEERSIANTYIRIGKLYVDLHKEDYETDFSEMFAIIRESEIKINDYKKQIQDVKGVVQCPQCGVDVPNGSFFCSSCGTKMPEIQEVIPEDSVKCEKCGAYVKKEMRFCTMCGNNMEKDSISNQGKICSSCGALVEDISVFCTECGNKM